MKHRHIVKLGLTLLVQANLRFKFWWDVVYTTVYHINKLSTPVLKLLSSYEKLFKHKLDYNFLKCFGCLCYPYLRDFNKYKGYQCLTSLGQVCILRHVIFDENTFPYSINSDLSSAKNITEHETPVSNFFQQQIYYLSILSLPNNNFEDTYSTGLARQEQVLSSSVHTDTLYQQEQSNHTLSESSYSHIPSQLPELPQMQLEPQTASQQQQNPNKTSFHNLVTR